MTTATENRAQLTEDHMANFVLAGNARFTLVSKLTGARFTYRVNQPKDGNDPGFYFVSVLSGSDNENDYSYLGFIRNNEFIYGRGKPGRIGQNAPSWKAFDWFFKRLVVGWDLSQVEVWHEGRCGRCGRALTVPESIASGIGPVCAGRE